eukprot:8040048-Lingulodinium_polyedra.AAC.1
MARSALSARPEGDGQECRLSPIRPRPAAMSGETPHLSPWFRRAFRRSCTRDSSRAVVLQREGVW